MNTNKANKQQVNVRLDPALLDRLNTASEKTGLKKTTIIEQGTRLRVEVLERGYRH